MLKNVLVSLHSLKQWASAPLFLRNGELLDILLCITYIPSLTGRNYFCLFLEEEFKDTKGVIKIRISMKNRQHNGQKKKYKRTNNDIQNIHIKLKTE
jgi:hypothetical protein